jgi:CRP-like cAMP-binding protein
MIQDDFQIRAVEALKLFNNSITTCRLYPPQSRQVANAVERAFSTLSTFLERFGALEFSLIENKPGLCGVLLEQEVLDSFPNLVIYRQLQSLELSQLVLGQNMDRFAFDQLLIVFAAPVAKIKARGGGKEFVSGLGLTGYFPDRFLGNQKTAQDKPESQKKEAEKKKQVRPEIVSCLLGNDKRPLVVEELQNKMKDANFSKTILSLAIHNILEEQREVQQLASPLFRRLLVDAERLINKMQSKEIAIHLGNELAVNCVKEELYWLVFQDYPQGFGAEVYNSLLTSLPMDTFGAVVQMLRKKLVKLRRSGKKSGLILQFNHVYNRLMNSAKGKQYQGFERARTVLKDGERTRQRIRLERGLSALTTGNNAVLENDELLAQIPHLIRQLSFGSTRSSLPNILANILSYLARQKGARRNKVFECLLGIAEKLIEAKDYDLIDFISNTLIIEAVQNVSNKILFAKNLKVLQIIMQEYLKQHEYEKSDRILNIIYQIRSGKIPKPSSFKAIAAKTQDNSLDRQGLMELLRMFIAAPQDEAHKNRLVKQGPIAARFLVEALIQEKNSENIAVLIRVLKEYGTFLPVVLRDRLSGYLPWYGKKNLIRLMAEIGLKEDIDVIVPYLLHSDFRVQHEAFCCLSKISGRKRRQIYLSVLHSCSDALRLQIVKAFAFLCDQEVALQLGELLHSAAFTSEKYDEQLLIAVIETLGRCQYPEASEALRRLLKTKGKGSTQHIPERVWAVLEKEVVFLNSELQEAQHRLQQARQFRKKAVQPARQQSNAGAGKQVITGLPEEKNIHNLLAMGDSTTAVTLLLQLLERTVRGGDFDQAEQLREWLLDIQGRTLSAVVSANDIIDRERSPRFSDAHLGAWSDFYDMLTAQQFEELFRSLLHRKYWPGERLVNQGEPLTGLFFINSGQLKLSVEKGQREFLLKIIGGGETFGSGICFDVSVWEMSVTSLGVSEVSMLPYNKLRQWKEKIPDLEMRLKNCCADFEGVQQLLDKSAQQRLKHTSKKLMTRATTVLLDNSGRRISRAVNVDLIDISRSGISCDYRGAGGDNSGEILGHRAQVDIPGRSEKEQSIRLNGDIVAVTKPSDSEQHSFHMQFREKLSPQQFETVSLALQGE